MLDNSCTTRSTPAPNAAEGDLEEVLLHAQALLESAVSHHRARSSMKVVELPFDVGGLRANAALLAGQARRDIACVIPAGRFEEETLDLVVETLSAATERGVRARVVCTPESTETQRGTRFLASLSASVQVRIAPCPLEELLVVDDHLALVRTANQTVRQMALVQEPAVVQSLSALFNCTWDVVGAGRDAPRMRVPSELSGRIIASLGSGSLDDAAARGLKVSVRTYRRYVAQIMQDLGGRSRFQAGILAAQLGLVPDDDPLGPDLRP